MKNKEKPSTSSESSAATAGDGKPVRKEPIQEPRSTDEALHKIDRPGFDLGGSSGETHAGTGLGLGEDAFDTPGDRRLPGRRLDNKLTIPRWSGPEPHDTAASVKKTAGAETPSAPKTKKAR